MRNNAKSLQESIKQLREGKFTQKELVE